MTEKTVEKAGKPEPEIPVILLKGYQPLDTTQQKIAKGKGAMLPLSEAKVAIANKVAVRNDPLPGDE